ncbi:hypothetical protein MTO96_033150 [Rhipicephalus appendiculatus]
MPDHAARVYPRIRLRRCRSASEERDEEGGVPMRHQTSKTDRIVSPQGCRVAAGLRRHPVGRSPGGLRNRGAHFSASDSLTVEDGHHPTGACVSTLAAGRR